MKLLGIIVLIFIAQFCQFMTPDEYLNLDIDDYQHPNKTEELTEEQLKIIESIKQQDDSLMYEHINHHARGNDAFYEGQNALLENDELQLIIIWSIITLNYQRKIQCIKQKQIQKIQGIKSRQKQ